MRSNLEIVKRNKASSLHWGNDRRSNWTENHRDVTYPLFGDMPQSDMGLTSALWRTKETDYCSRTYFRSLCGGKSRQRIPTWCTNHFYTVWSQCRNNSEVRILIQNQIVLFSFGQLICTILYLSLYSGKWWREREKNIHSHWHMFA